MMAGFKEKFFAGSPGLTMGGWVIRSSVWYFSSSSTDISLFTGTSA
jgi:hypothetical protein